MLSRYTYFIIDKLNITKAERIAMVTITTLIVLISTGAAMLSPDIPFPEEHYAYADSLFRALSEQKSIEHAELMARYEPPLVESASGNTAIAGALPSGAHAEVSAMSASSVLGASNTGKKAAASKGSAKAPAPESIVLNTSDAATLARLPGVGPKTAEAIVAYRNENGPFQDLSHIMRVKGIGAKKWEQIRPYLRLNE